MLNILDVVQLKRKAKSERDREGRASGKGKHTKHSRNQKLIQRIEVGDIASQEEGLSL